MILPLILEWINFLKFCTTYWMFNKIELEKMNTIIEVVLKQETSPQFSKFLCYLLYRFNIGSGRLFQGPFTQELFTCNLGSLILGFDKLCYKVWASANSRPCWKWDRHVESLRSEFVGPKPMGFQALFSFCPELGFLSSKSNLCVQLCAFCITIWKGENSIPILVVHGKHLCYRFLSNINVPLPLVNGNTAFKACGLVVALPTTHTTLDTEPGRQGRQKIIPPKNAQ